MRDIASGQSFANFYNENCIYVDKTKELYSMIKFRRVFFSRPRRFGKSTALNTIGTLFEKGIDPYFKNTWIYDKWTEKTYPVLRLNFLEFSVTSYDEFVVSFNLKLQNFAKKNNLIDFVPQKSISDSFISFFDALNDKQIIILIDEYDCQLTANINNPQLYNIFQQNIRKLYGVMKDKEAIKFLGITGVTRLKDVSIFSVGSDIKDITYEHSISTLTGFTKDEIRKFYIDYLSLTASIRYNVSLEAVTPAQKEQILDELAFEYNGYCFDQYYENKVFSTWSINNFFMSVANDHKIKYSNFWYDNGGLPSILKNYLESHELHLNDYTNENIVVTYDNFLNPSSLLTIDQNVLMCQSGYLTLRSPIQDGYDVKLCIPNNEVKRALSRLLCFKITSNKYGLNYDSLEMLKTGTASNIIEFFNKFIKTISYEKYPITNESVLRGYLHLILLCYRVRVAVEVQNSKGRSDIQLDFDNRRIVIELKFAKDATEVQDKLKQAKEQIKARDYGNDRTLQGELLRLALVFNGQEREFTSYELV